MMYGAIEVTAKRDDGRDTIIFIRGPLSTFTNEVTTNEANATHESI